MDRYLIKLLFFLLFFTQAAIAIQPDELLPPDQAFRISAIAREADRIQVSWDIEDGYYLYRKKFAFVSKTAGVKLGEANLPPGKVEHDEFFGDVETYRGKVDIDIPIIKTNATNILQIEAKSQGCADLGICYPPHQQLVELQLPSATIESTSLIKADNSFFKLNQALKNLGLTASSDDLLKPDEAFQFDVQIKDSTTLQATWQIAEGYYLYREKFQFELVDSNSVQLGEVRVPHGQPKYDNEFGHVEVFYHNIDIDLPLFRSSAAPANIILSAKYQGCAERGVCYPPIEKKVNLTLAKAEIGQLPITPAVSLSEQGMIAKALQNQTLWLTIVSFFGFGLALSFTPCVFPMIPILSGIIIGQGEKLSAKQSFAISLSYVLASAVTYTIFGILAGLFGQNLQAAFQQPWLIVSFCIVFVLLAMSMFGFYDLQIPKTLQEKLRTASNTQHGGTLVGAAVMGALSALIIGPCVAAPLAAVLIYIGQSGDAVLGGLALFAMGMGMGVPLLLIGVSAGKLLPKAGAWMITVKSVFGVAMLAVAVWLLERIIPASVTMILWALLLIIPAIYMSALDSLPTGISGWHKLWKGAGIFMLSYGILILVGVASGSSNPLQPLQGLAQPNSQKSRNHLTFERIASVSKLDEYLRVAGDNGKWTMLDFYADWCISCKEMENFTFSDPKVRSALANVKLIQADVTKNSEDDKELLSRFDLIGPPAILFFGPDRNERGQWRVIGYKNTDEFLNHLSKIGV